jgi:DNA repair protein RadC
VGSAAWIPRAASHLWSGVVMIFPSAGVHPGGLALPPSMHGRRLGRRFDALGADAPARRLHELGPRDLAVRELLALLLDPGRGREKAERAAASLLAHYAGRDGRMGLRAIGAAPLVEIARAAGVGPAPAARVAAALELGRRAASESILESNRLSTARDVYELMRLNLRDLPQEELHALLLDTQNQLIRDVLVSRGTVNATLAHPREVFRPAIQEAATAVVLVHNHPGRRARSPSPSGWRRRRPRAPRGCSTPPPRPADTSRAAGCSA